jgi:hypothetical protein
VVLSILDAALEAAVLGVAFVSDAVSSVIALPEPNTGGGQTWLCCPCRCGRQHRFGASRGGVLADDATEAMSVCQLLYG